MCLVISSCQFMLANIFIIYQSDGIFGRNVCLFNCMGMGTDTITT